MTSRRLLRRAAVFAGVFGGGMTVVVWAVGGVFVESPAAASLPTAPVDFRGPVVPLVPGAGLGPGRGGRLDRESVAAVGDRLVPWRELTAEWGTATPVESNEPEVSLQRLTDARLVFFPRPTEEDPHPAAKETAPGVTIVSGRTALLRRKEGAAPSAHLEGDCVASHALDGGETLVLSSDALDFRRDDRGGGRSPVQVIETDRPVRMDGGGATLTGTGLAAELDAGTRSSGRRAMHLDRDVAGVFRQRAAETGREDSEVRVRCAGAADVESLDRASRDGRQPWRSTFRDDVHLSDTTSTMTSQHLVVDFVQTGRADRAAGSGTAEIRSLVATGRVVIDGVDVPGTDSGGPRRGAASQAPQVFHAECEQLRRFAEDAVTDVTILDGKPYLRFEGRAQDAAGDGKSAAPTSTYEVRCTGPVTIRERRTVAGRRTADAVTFVFEGDVVATERRTGETALRSDVRAPRVTVEARRGPDGRIDPRVIRAEQGAVARFVDFAARAQTITAVAPEPGQAGGMRHVALVGKPQATWTIREGASPAGGRDGAGRLVVDSDGRIDADLAPDPPAGTTPAGTRTSARVTGGMTARKFVGDAKEPTWTLVAREGDGKTGWDGAIEEMHATGDAHLWGTDDGGNRAGDLTGGRISVQRATAAAAPRGAAPKDAGAWKALDVRVEGVPGALATAVVDDTKTTGRRHVIRALDITRTDAGPTLLAKGSVHADLHRAADAKSEDATLTLDCDDLRADLVRGGDGRETASLLTATGKVRLAEASYGLHGERVTYRVATGEAEAVGAPAQITRNEPPVGTAEPFTSYARGPRIRAWFDPKGARDQAFRRALLPDGGEIVGYFVDPAHRRVTTTAKGPIEMTRTSASCLSQVVAVFEQMPAPDVGWHNDARIDCERLDMTFDPTKKGGAASEKIQTFVAQGTPDAPAKIRTRSPAGDREAYAEAERIEAEDAGSTLYLTCPSDRTSVYANLVSEGTRFRCDSVRFNFRTFEWFDMFRGRVVE